MSFLQTILNLLLALLKRKPKPSSPAAPKPSPTAEPAPAMSSSPPATSVVNPAPAASNPEPAPPEPAAAPQPAAPPQAAPTTPVEPADTTTNAPTPVEPLEPLPLEIKEVTSNQKLYIHVTDGTQKVQFRAHKKGVFTFGRCKAIDFIHSAPPALEALQLPASALRAMQPVSANEGNLDAVNTWDNSFMTFGMFQWTIGAGDEAGELPAMMLLLRQRSPEAFDRYFGRYGLGLSENTNKTYGFVTLKDKMVRAAAAKVQFRSPEWAFRFWNAGQDPAVQAAEVEHAVNRLKTFYWKPNPHLNGRAMAEFISSEYGVSLLLDNHVNRPGYVDRCLQAALQQENPGDPAGWSTADEQRVLAAYLRIRQAFGKSPMTHAAQRAATVGRYADRGELSRERGSFIFPAEGGARSLGAPTFDDYPEVMDFDEQSEALLEREEGIEE